MPKKPRLSKTPSSELSSGYNLFRVEEGELFPCCFCPSDIEAGQEMMVILVGRKRRAAHYGCVIMALSKLIEMRDEKGRSEDLKRRSSGSRSSVN